MPMLHPGGRIFHPDYGAGTLLGLLSGMRARVRFDRMHLLPRSVEVASLTPESGPIQSEEEKDRLAPSVPKLAATRAKAAAAAAQSKDTARIAASAAAVQVDPETASVRQALEALRLGVVPSDHVEGYTVGRSTEVKSVQALIAAERGIRIVWGEYGAGKTHILDVAENEGLRSGFVTARVVLNPQEVPPTHPLRLYRAFVRNLRYPDHTEVGWRPLFSRLEKSAEHAGMDGAGYSRFFSPVLFALRSGNEDAIDWAADYIEGYQMDSLAVTQALRKIGWRGERLLTLSDYRTYGRMYVHMMGNLACWARDAGYKGLLLLMDEVEYIDALAFSNLLLAREVLMHYAAATLPASSLGFEPAGLYRGGHGVHRALEIQFQAGQPLSVIMAFTPLTTITQFAMQFLKDEDTNIWLKPLDSGDLRVLVGKIADLYGRGYPQFKPQEAHVERLRRRILSAADSGDNSPREMVRTSVSVLDCLRYGRDPFDGQSAVW